MSFPEMNNKYRLELHWSDVLYKEDGVCSLIKAYFSGPVLKIAGEINPKDNMVLDMTNQYVVFLPSFYLAKLGWKDVEYDEDGGKVYLKKVVLVNRYLNSVPKFGKTDYFVLNLEKHEEELHPYNLTYEAYLVNENGEVYKF